MNYAWQDLTHPYGRKLSMDLDGGYRIQITRTADRTETTDRTYSFALFHTENHMQSCVWHDDDIQLEDNKAAEMHAICRAIEECGDGDALEALRKAWSQHYPGQNPVREALYADGDIYLNPFFGDLWIVENGMFVKINDGYEVPVDEPAGFVKVGHAEGLTTKRADGEAAKDKN